MGKEDGAEVSWLEEILQMIFCRIPYPLLYKVQAISKSWRAKFSDALCSANPGCKSFQGDVLSTSGRWPTFCPVFLSGNKLWTFMRMYNQTSQRWQEIRFRTRRKRADNDLYLSKISGPLVFLANRDLDVNHDKKECGLVINIFTGTCKILTFPSEAELRRSAPFVEQSLMETFLDNRPPDAESNLDFVGMVFGTDMNGYKVHLLYHLWGPGVNGGYRGFVIHLYDSTTRTWEEVSAIGQLRLYKRKRYKPAAAYLDGSLYFLCVEQYPNHRLVQMHRYRFEGGKWTQCKQFGWLRLRARHKVTIVTVDTKLMVVTLLEDEEEEDDESSVSVDVNVYEVDKETLDWKINYNMIVQHRLQEVTSDSESIFFCPKRVGEDYEEQQILAYNVTNSQWRWIQPPEIRETEMEIMEKTSYTWTAALLSGAFQPGFQPFTSV